MDNWLPAVKENKIIYSFFLMRQWPNVHFAPCFELSCRLSCRLSFNCLVIVLHLSCSPCWTSLVSRGQLGKEGQSRPDRRHHLLEQAWAWRLVLPGKHGRRPKNSEMIRISTTCIKILMHIACKDHFQGWAIQGAVSRAWASAAAGQG